MHGCLENGAWSPLTDYMVFFSQSPLQEALFNQLTYFKEFVPSAFLLTKNSWARMEKMLNIPITDKDDTSECFYAGRNQIIPYRDAH